MWDSLKGNQVPIKPCNNDLSNYDCLIVCSPVWAGRTPAAVNEYLSMVKHAKDKSFGWWSLPAEVEKRMPLFIFVNILQKKNEFSGTDKDTFR